MYKPLASMLLAAAAVISSPPVRAQQATAPVTETPKGMLAAQIRIQGFACDNPLYAVKDKKRSKPDHEVWVLRCSNATYRVSRVPDMAATVELVR